MRIIGVAILVLVASVIVSSCTGTRKEKQVSSISELEKQVYTGKALDRGKSLHLIDTYISYSKQFPNDSLSADYVFRAANLAMNLNLSHQAILYFDLLENNFPDYSKVPESMFLKAFVYENQLKDLNKAKRYYQEFIRIYPQHPLVKDAKASIQYLGKSPEELIRIFQSKSDTSVS